MIPLGGCILAVTFPLAAETPDYTFVHGDRDNSLHLQATLSATDTNDLARRPYFNRQPRLRHLSVEAALDSLAPVLGVADGADMNGAALLLSCGRGRAASLRSLRRGVGVMEMSPALTLASRITAVFTFAESRDTPLHKFIVVSFRDRTKVLAVGDSRVEEVTTTGFQLAAPTLCAGLLGTASPVQVHPHGVRFIPDGRPADTTEWTPPLPGRIIAACCNSAQLIVALSSGAVVYFEVDDDQRALLEIDRVSNAFSDRPAAHAHDYPPPHHQHHPSASAGVVPALAIPQVPPGRARASFFAVADAVHSKVRVYRVAPDGSPQPLGLHVAPAPIESVAFVDFGIRERGSGFGSGATESKSSNSNATDDTDLYQPALNVIIGTKHGAIVRVSVDGDTGSLGDKRTLFIGPERVRCYPANMGGVTTCFALGSYPHLLYAQGGRIETSPISGGDTFAHVAPLCSEEFPGGFVAAHGSKMRLLCIDLLHALQAGSHSSLRRCAPSALAAQTRISSLFHLSRTRMHATIRRIARVSETPVSLSSSSQQKQKRPKTQSLFVLGESEHRVKVRHLNNNSNKPPNIENALPGSWFSRLSLVRLRGADGIDNGPPPSRSTNAGSGAGGENIKTDEQIGDGENDMNENDSHNASGQGAEEGVDPQENPEDDMEFDETDPLVNFNMDAVTILDQLRMPDSNDCIVAVTTTCAFGVPTDGSVPDNDTISYVIVSRACNSVVSATSSNAEKERAIHHHQFTSNIQSNTEDQETIRKLVRRKPDQECFGMLSVYRVNTQLRLIHVHDTRISEPAYVVIPFRDMVAVGVGKAIRLYALGKKQLLRKVEYRAAVRNRICAMSSAGGDRLFVADKQESVTLFKYVCRPTVGGANGAPGRADMGVNGYQGGQPMVELSDGGRLVAIASDETSRWVTCLHTLDYSTVCGGDMFGNVFILRLPPEVTPGAEEIGHANGHAVASTLDASMNNVPIATATGTAISGAALAAHRLRVEACLHVGSAVTVVTTGRLDCGHHPSLTDALKQYEEEVGVMYATMDGAVGIIKPLATRSDADFAKRLQMAMRKAWRSPVGRDHLAYRSSFYVSRGVVDGDLCELFVSASAQQRKKWAEEVARSEHDIDRKLDELRAMIV